MSVSLNPEYKWLFTLDYNGNFSLKNYYQLDIRSKLRAQQVGSEQKFKKQQQKQHLTGQLYGVQYVHRINAVR